MTSYILCSLQDIFGEKIFLNPKLWISISYLRMQCISFIRYFGVKSRKELEIFKCFGALEVTQ